MDVRICPYVISPVELIVILYKDYWKKQLGSKESDVSLDELMEWTNGVWTFNGESKKRVGHPAPFSRELPIAASSCSATSEMPSSIPFWAVEQP